MPLINDLKAGRRLIRNLLRSRRTRRALAERLETMPPLDPDTFRIVVYFADTRVNLYQIRQWYAPLAELAQTHKLAIISRSPGAAMALLDEAPVPTV